MSLKAMVEVNILDQKLLIKSEEGEEHIKQVTDYLNSKIEEVKEHSRVVSTLSIALLAAMNIAGEHFATKERLSRVEQSAKKLSERIAKEVD